MADGARLNVPLPDEDIRGADAPFVKHPLTATQRSFFGDPARFGNARVLVAADPAVIRREDHERVLRQLQGFELRQYAADALIDAGDHRGVSRIAMTSGC